MKMDGDHDFTRYTLDIDDDSEGDYHRNANLDDELSGRNRRNNDSSNTYLERIALPDRMNKKDFETIISKLNIKQRDYLTHVINHV